MATNKFPARYAKFFIEDVAGAAWLRIKGLSSFTRTIETGSDDTSDFDSAGWGSEMNTSLKLTIGLEGKYLLDYETGTRDAGQQEAEGLAMTTGPAGVRRFRLQLVNDYAAIGASGSATIEAPNHNFEVGDEVYVYGDVLPAELVDGSLYFVKTVAEDVITLAVTADGTAIDLTGDFEGSIGKELGRAQFRATYALSDAEGDNDATVTWGCEAKSQGRPFFSGALAH